MESQQMKNNVKYNFDKFVFIFSLIIQDKYLFIDVYYQFTVMFVISQMKLSKCYSKKYFLNKNKIQAQAYLLNKA